jgi:hypothetical protein
MTTLEAEQFINNEMNLRIKLVEDVKFRELCVKMCKQLGITSSEWNKNKMEICLFIANQFIGFDAEEGKLREYLTN